MNESLKAIIKQTDMLLWNSYHASLDSQYDALNTRLIFPKSASKSIRVSEQEARFIFSNQLNNSTFLFSVETLTQQGYQQKGKKKTGARTDLTIYSGTGKRILNVEFKAVTISTRATKKTKFPISKDIQKMLHEENNGLWFHILESVNNSTIKELFGTFKESILECIKESDDAIKNKNIIFHICVLKHKFSLQRELKLEINEELENNLDEFFNVDYSVSRDNLKSFSNDQGWIFFPQ